MQGLLNGIWILAALSTAATYLVWRKRWTEGKFSRAYFRKYSWILRVWIFPLITIYVLMANGLKAFCIAIFVTILASLFLRFALGRDHDEISLERRIALVVTVVVTALSLRTHEPDWVQSRITVLGSLLLASSAAAIAFNKPNLSLFRLSRIEKSGYASKWRWLSFALALFGIVMISLNEYFRHYRSLEEWALFDAFGGVVLIFLILLFVLPTIGIFSSEETIKSDTEVND